jgi:hypothetical protein
MFPVFLGGTGGRIDAGVDGDLFLRLRHAGRCSVEQSKARPHRLGVFDVEGEAYHGEFLGVDWQGCVYLSDPISPQQIMLKCFARNGKFQQAWGPVRCDSLESCAVTKDGHVWLGPWNGGANGAPGLPVVAYYKGSPTPLIDWRRKLPDGVAEGIREAVLRRGLKWTDAHEGWLPCSFESSANRISLKFVGGVIGSEDGEARTLWVLLSGDGKQVVRVEIVGKEVPTLSSDDRIWLRANDLSAGRWSWSKVWLWPERTPRREPVIDRTSAPEPWRENLVLGETSPPATALDARHIYLIWQRGWGPNETQFRYAATILDRKLQPVMHLPWRLGFAKWLRPAPEGSGFYRYEYAGNESRVYHHSLTK